MLNGDALGVVPQRNVRMFDSRRGGDKLRFGKDSRPVRAHHHDGKLASTSGCGIIDAGAAMQT